MSFLTLAFLNAETFAGFSTVVLLVTAAVAVAALVKGADWLVEGASGFAYRIGMPKVIVGATIVSLGTTSPEAAVSVVAAWSGEPGLALGNAVGSIIADTALIFGLGAVMVALPADKFVLTRQGWVQFGSAVLLALICYALFFFQGDNAQIGHVVGILLLALLGYYMYMSVKWARVHPQGEPFMTPDDMQDNIMSPSVEVSAVEASLTKQLLAGLGGLLIVLVASRVMVLSMSQVAENWGVPDVVIAGTLVAMGTSLPELVVGMTALWKGHRELLVGNVIGADILNVLFVVGASAAFSPSGLPIIEADTEAPRIFLQLHLPAMLIVLVLFRIFIWMAVRKGEFSRWMGVPLLVLYVAYAAGQYFVSGTIAH